MSPERASENASRDLLWGLLDLWVVVLVALTGVSLFHLDPGVLPTVSLLLVLLFMFLLPGYALISALQPRRPQRSRSAGRDRYEPTVASEGGMALTERLVLATGASVGIVTATGFASHLTGIGIEPGPTSVVLTAITLIGCVVAAVRRYRLHPDVRFDGREVIRSSAPIRGLFVRRSTIDRAITSLIVVSVVVAVAGGAFIAVSVDDRESYTELYVLSANETGEPVAAEYPSDEEGTEEILIGVTNREDRTMNYTLIVHHQLVDGDAEVRSEERDRYDIDLPRDDEWRTEYPVPTDDDRTGERLVFLLYEGSPPDDPDRESAYRAVHVWLDDPDDTA
ncbi:DUF1616 domain-containing protein [Halorubrum sp. DTA98]|uniref:DUF1616 domain-containing protein n=1 Tax=Halorubrum sp. DTA98 TaxID=3402163 RepID=UPI003AAECD8C